MGNVEIATLFLFSYLLGSIPFSLIVSKLFTGIDIRNVASGNIGATNVFRVNKKASIVALALDVSKSAVFLVFCKRYGLSNQIMYLIGMTSIVGHMFPIWLKFKGGKGVASILGVIIAMNIKVFSVFFCTWAVVFCIFRYSSMSSIAAIVSSSVMCFLVEDLSSATVYFVMSIMVIARHRSNILRVLNNTEHKT